MEASQGQLDVTISENMLEGEVFRKTPKQYNDTYRLETNNQLYEGIRCVTTYSQSSVAP